MRGVIIVILAVMIVLILYRVIRKLRDKAAVNNVIQMSLDRGNKKYVDKQKCSMCKKRSKHLSFYANEFGKAIGVCDHCRPIAERRALLRL